MKFDTPATKNPIDQLKVVGKPVDRIDGPLKTTGTAPYANDRHDVVANQAYGYIVPLGDRQGPHRLDGPRRRESRARRASRSSRPRTPASSARATSTPRCCWAARRSSITTRRSRSSWPRPSSRRAPRPTWCACEYARAKGAYRPRGGEGHGASPPTASAAPAESEVGDFAGAFAAAPVQLDATYTTAHESHSMMEPHATHRRVGRRPAHALDLEPDDRLDARRTWRRRSASRRRRCASCRPTSAAASARSSGCAPTRCWPRSVRVRRDGR